MGTPERGATLVYWYCIGIMEKKVEATIMGYMGGYIGITEKKMEALKNPWI